MVLVEQSKLACTLTRSVCYVVVLYRALFGDTVVDQLIQGFACLPKVTAASPQQVMRDADVDQTSG